MKVRKRRHSDSWQVVYIDLMTNIMIFFVIFWALNQGKEKGLDDAIGNQTTQMVSLPGDVLFKSGQTAVTSEGKQVFNKLFKDETGAVLTFENTALTNRMLVIHGHTDGDGTKVQNLNLGFQRAMSAYHEIKTYSKDLPDHIIICSHADNSPTQDVPILTGKMSKTQTEMISKAKAKNRRITIEDKVIERTIMP